MDSSNDSDSSALGLADIAGDWATSCHDCPWWETELSYHWALGLSKVHAVAGHQTSVWVSAVVK